MPIIPRQEIAGGVQQITTPNFRTPDIDAFPDAYNAKVAAAVGGVANAVSDAAQKHAAVNGYLKASSLADEYAISLQKAADDLRTAPQKTIEGVSIEGDLEGTSSMVTTTLVPRYQSYGPDFEKKRDEISRDIMKRGGDSQFVQRHLGPRMDRINRAAQIAVSKQTTVFQQEDTRMTVVEGADQLAKQAFSARTDQSYESIRNGIARRYDEAVQVGGMPADVAEKAKLSQLAKLDHGRAAATMTENPGPWLAASGAGANGWASRLTEDQMLRLDERAEKLLKRGEETATQERMRIQRETTQDWVARVEPDAALPLTVSEVVRAATDRKIDAPTAEHWKAVVKNLAAGGWDDQPDVKVRMGLQAGSFSVQPEFMDRVDSMVRGKQLSLKTGEEYKSVARSIIQKRNDVSQTEDYKMFSATQVAMNTMLTTSPLLGAKMDQESQTIRANAQSALLDNAQRNGWGTSFEWWKKNQERFVTNLADRVDSQVDVLNSALPKPLLKDPKSRQILPETIQGAQSELFQRYKIAPEEALALKRAGKLPAGLMNELRTLDELQKWTGYQADYRSKRTTPGGQ